MEHPLISNLNNLTAPELAEKLSELHKKLAIAYRTGNSHLCDQIRMAIDSYQTTYNEKLRKDSGGTFNDVIDIS